MNIKCETLPIVFFIGKSVNDKMHCTSRTDCQQCLLFEPLRKAECRIDVIVIVCSQISLVNNKNCLFVLFFIVWITATNILETILETLINRLQVSLLKILKTRQPCLSLCLLLYTISKSDLFNVWTKYSILLRAINSFQI